MKINSLIFCMSVVVLSSGCSTLSELGVPKPKVTLQDVKFSQADTKNATLVFDVEVENPYTVDLPLMDLDYTLTTQLNPLFKGKADIATTIPAKEKKILSLPVTLSYTDIMNAVKTLKDVGPGSVIPYEAAVSISSKAPVLGTVRIPVQRSGQLTVPTVQNAEAMKKIMDMVGKIRSKP